MNEFIEKCYCSNDKYIWIGGSLVVFTLLIISAMTFEWFPEPTYAEVEEVKFWVWYGLAGFGIMVFFLLMGGYSIWKYCTYEKVKAGETDVRYFIMIFGFVFFLIVGIIGIVVIDNFENDFDRLKPTESYSGSTGSSGYSGNYGDENYVRDIYPKKFTLFNDWISNGECDLLIDWAERNYLHDAITYATRLILEHDCEEKHLKSKIIKLAQMALEHENKSVQDIYKNCVFRIINEPPHGLHLNTGDSRSNVSCDSQPIKKIWNDLGLESKRYKGELKN